MLAWTLLGLSLYAAAAALAEVAYALEIVTPVFLQTIGMCLVPYGLAYVLLDRTLHIPPIEGNSLVSIAALLPFAGLLGLCAIFRPEYSRGAILVCTVITLIWLWLGYRVFVSRYVPVFGYLEQTDLNRLHAMLATSDNKTSARAEFRHIATLPEAAQCDGLMMSRSAAADPNRTRMLARFKLSHIRLYSVDRVGEILSGRMSLEHIDESFLDDHAQNYLYMPAKRIGDILAVLLVSPITLPLGLIVAAAIRMESNGPAIFRQQRVGLYGSVFTMHKFRSMSNSPDIAARFADRHDVRVTRVGRFIRKYRLDEIPQLWNVLVGQMSLIGPRPEQVSLVDQFSESIAYYPYRHLVRPGLSGWAQVQQGYAATHDETVIKLSYDLYYVKHCSLALDLLICAKTLRTLATGYGAR